MGVEHVGGSGPPLCDNEGIPKQAKRKMKCPSQLEALEKAYTVSSTLSEQKRQELAQRTALSSREISMWFANKRFQGKQALLLREKNRENAIQLTVPSQPIGSGNRSSKNEVLIGEWSAPLQVIPQQQASQHALDQSMLTYVEKKLGGPLRADGPLVGMNFDSVPPGAFGAPFCSGYEGASRNISEEVMRKLEQTIQTPIYHNTRPDKASSIFQHTNSSCLQRSVSTTPVDKFECTVHPDSVYNFSTKLSCFPSEKLLPETKEMHPEYALQDAQSFHPINDIVDKFVLTDTLANDATTSQLEWSHKSEDAQTANRDEDLDSRIMCKKCGIKRKNEVHSYNKQNKEEAIIHEKQCDKLHCVSKPCCCKKLLKNGNFGDEKVRKPKEQYLGVATTEEAGDGTFKSHGNIQTDVQLIDDEQLELMKLAASSKGLSSSDYLDKDTLDNLHSFQDMLGNFPPKSVIMKHPFPIPPWTESEERVGNLVMVWKFLVTFAGEFGLWPFTLEEFTQAFHDHDSRLLGEIHVSLLKFIIKDLEDMKSARAYTHDSKDNVDNQGCACLNIVDGAHAWGFDIHFWKRKLNFLTWPEILRQFALSAGFGPKLNNGDYANLHGDKCMNAGDQAAEFDNDVAGGINSVLVQEKENSSCDSSYQLTPGTLVFAVFHALFHVGSEGLTSVQIADYIKEHGLCNLTASESAHASITNILSTDTELFESAGLLTYRLNSCFERDHSIAKKIFSGATKTIHLCRHDLSKIELSNQNFKNSLTERDEDLGGGINDHNLGDKRTRRNWYNLNGVNALASFGNIHQNMHLDSRLIDKTGFEKLDQFSSVFLDGAVEDRITQIDEFFDSIHELDSASGDVKRSDFFSESWVQELTNEEYSSLSTEERLKVLVALVDVIVDGNLFHIFIEERLKEAQVCKRMVREKIRLNKRLQEEKINANLMTSSKLVPRPCDYSSINYISTQKNNLGLKFSSSLNGNLHELFEQTPVLSQLKVYIDQKVELVHPYRFLPLGKDRRHNRYWQFSTSSSRNDPGSGRIFFESNDGFWKVIDSDEAFDAILCALDTRGIRESHLYFMLKCIETTFKDTTRRIKNNELHASTIEKQPTISSDCTSDYSTTSTSVPSTSETPRISASLDIGLLSNAKESSSSKKYLHFMKWMWQECFNPDLLCAMRYGTKRCVQLLETCHICYQSYLAEEKHCTSCHMTFNICNAYENFSAHVAGCEVDFKRKLSFPLYSINIQLLKAQLAIIEASIPMEAFYSSWNDCYRKSWGIQLNLSSSAREIFQNLTLLESAIKTDCLCPDFITTNELLSSEKNILFDNMATVSEPVPVIPWIPNTSAAVALRLLDLDASIPYMLQPGLEPVEGTEVGEFLVLPHSELLEPVHQVESAVSDDTDDQSRDHRRQDKDRGGRESCTGMERKVLSKRNLELEDFNSSDYIGEIDINNVSSGRLRVETPTISSYETNAGSINLHTKAMVLDGEDEIEHGDESGGGHEAVESNEYHRLPEDVDSYLDIEDYLDVEQSEGKLSNIVLEKVENHWDAKDNVIYEKGFITSGVREENSSPSVNSN